MHAWTQNPTQVLLADELYNPSKILRLASSTLSVLAGRIVSP